MGLLDGQIAKAIYDGFKGKLLKGVIRQSAALQSGGLDALGDPTAVEITITKCEGFTENYSEYFRATAGIPDSDLKVNIFAMSMPGVRPGKDDKVRLGSSWYQLRTDATDPAGALWTCRAFPIADPT